MSTASSLPETLEAYAVTDGFGLKNLKRVHLPMPKPGPGQVLVRVSACCLNYRDLMMVRGQYNPHQPLPLVPLSDGVGEVVAVGPGVKLELGTRVTSLFAQGWHAGDIPADVAQKTLGGPVSGMLASHVLLRADGVLETPSYLSDAEAATLPCAALTAWSALVTHGNIHAGETVLIQGTGGVSLFALQIATSLGARVIATSSTAEKLARVEKLGAWQTINYREVPKWGALARKLTGGRGVDHVVEIGGAGTLEQSLQALRPGGSLSMIGILSGISSQVNVIPILMNQLRIQGIFVGHRASFEAMNRALTHHQIHPVVDRIFSFADAPAAFEHFAERRHFGKVCIAMSPAAVD